MKFFKTIISSLKNTKLLIAIFFILSILVNYLITCVPVVIQYFIDYILKQENLRNGVLDWIVNFYENKIGFIAVICIVVSII